MSTVLLVDASPLIYAVYNAMGHFQTKAGEPTGLRFGFLRSIRSYADKVKPDKVVICFDSPGPVVKAEGIETYKANRVMTPEKVKMYEQVPALRELLALTKYTQVDAPGYEADDIIGSLARRLMGQGHDVYVVSPDNDLCQLVMFPKVKLWMPPKGKEKAWLKDHNWVCDQFQVQPNALLLWRAIEGDTSDNLEGLSLLTANTKEQFKARLRELAAIHQDRALTPDDLTSLQLSDGATKMVRVNYEVMKLVDPPVLGITKGIRDSEKLGQAFEALEMRSMLKHLPEFVQ